MRTNIRRYVSVLISLLLGLLLLWFIMRGQNTEQIISEFRHANYWWIGLAMLCALVSHFLRAMRWNMLIGAMGYQTKTVQTFYALMTGYLTNIAVPRMGEITRCVSLSRASGVPFNALAGTVVAERIFDLFTLIGIVFLTIAFQFNFLKGFIVRLFWDPLMDRTTDHWFPMAIITGIAVVAIIAVIFFLKRKLANPRKGSFFFRLKRQLSGFTYGVKTIKTMRNKHWFVFQTVLIWILYYLTVYLCFFAIAATAHLSPVVGFTLLAVGSLGILAPVPAGIGTYHFLTIITLTELYQIASEPATSYAYIAHANQIVVSIVAGVFSWIMLSMQAKKSHQNQHPETSKKHSKTSKKQPETATSTRNSNQQPEISNQHPKQ